MTDYRDIEERLRETFILHRHPVAVTFRAAPPANLGDDELYVAIPGRDLAKLATESQTIAAANAALSDYHCGRRRALSTE